MDFPISQLRVVQYCMRGRTGYQSEKLMHESQVGTFLAALLKLHYSPGINPHSQLQCAELWEVKLGKLALDTDSYWWCSPTLGIKMENQVPGAQLNTVHYDRLWAHPELLQEEQRAADLEDQWERDNS